MRRKPNKYVQTRRRIARRQRMRRVRLAQGGQQPGDVSATLRRRMDDALADIFSEAGRSLYASAVEDLKTVLRDNFNNALPGLDNEIKDELGKRGQRLAAEFYRDFINEIVEAIVTQGMNEASSSLEDVASSYAAKYSSEPDGEEAEGVDDLLGTIEEVDLNEVPEVEPEEVEVAEEEEVAPVPGLAPPALPELVEAPAEFVRLPRRRYRSRPRYRRVR